MRALSNMACYLWYLIERNQSIRIFFYSLNFCSPTSIRPLKGKGEKSVLPAFVRGKKNAKRRKGTNLEKLIQNQSYNHADIRTCARALTSPEPRSSGGLCFLRGSVLYLNLFEDGTTLISWQLTLSKI